MKLGVEIKFHKTFKTISEYKSQRTLKIEIPSILYMRLVLRKKLE